MSAVQVVIAFAIAGLAAYRDVDLFFRNTRTSYSVRCWWFWLFVGINGLLSVALLLWALEGDPSNPINVVIQVKSAWAKTVMIGFGVPFLIRSKLFGEGPSAAGPSALYDWAREKVLYGIHLKSGLIKEQLAVELSERYRDDTTFPDRLITFALEHVRPFYTTTELDALARDMNRVARKGNLNALIRMAIDSTSIGAIEKLASCFIGRKTVRHTTKMKRSHPFYDDLKPYPALMPRTLLDPVLTRQLRRHVVGVRAFAHVHQVIGLVTDVAGTGVAVVANRACGLIADAQATEVTSRFIRGWALWPKYESGSRSGWVWPAPSVARTRNEYSPGLAGAK